MVFTPRDKLIPVRHRRPLCLTASHDPHDSALPRRSVLLELGPAPSLAYSDHPPMVAWVMAFFTALGGNSELFVRLGGFLLSGAALFFLFFTARALFPAHRDLSWDVLLAFNVTLLFPQAASSRRLTRHALLLGGRRLVWKPDRGGWSRVVVVRLGGGPGPGSSQQVHHDLLVPCTFGFLLFCPSLRHWLTRKEPWLGLLIAWVLFSPVLYWNAQHDWLSFTYQLRQGFSPKQKAVPLKLLEYLGGQAGVITPILFVAFAGYSVKALRIKRKEPNPSYLYLLFLSCPFSPSSASPRPWARWPRRTGPPAYIAGFILAGAVYHEVYAARPAHRRFIAAGLVVGLLLGFVVQMHLMRPFLPFPRLRIRRGSSMAGGSLASRFPSSSISGRRSGILLVSDKGTTAAEAVFYSGARLTGVDLFQPERYVFLGICRA